MSTEIFSNLCVRDSTGIFSLIDRINGTFQISYNAENADNTGNGYKRLLEMGAEPIYPHSTEPYKWG